MEALVVFHLSLQTSLVCLSANNFFPCLSSQEKLQKFLLFATVDMLARCTMTWYSFWIEKSIKSCCVGFVPKMLLRQSQESSRKSSARVCKRFIRSSHIFMMLSSHLVIFTSFAEFIMHRASSYDLNSWKK